MLYFDAVFSFFHLEWQLLLKDFVLFCFVFLRFELKYPGDYNLVCNEDTEQFFSIACGQYTSDLAF